MWQSLVRSWLLRAARERMQAEAGQAASGGPSPDSASRGETGPGQFKAVESCDVGLVFALAIEAGGLTGRMQGVLKTQGAGFIAREGALAGKRLVLFECGAGRKAAAAGAAALIAGHRPSWIVSAGFAGGLDESVRQGDIVMADKLLGLDGQQLDVDLRVDSQVLEKTSRLHVGGLLTVDRIIHAPEEKRNLGCRFRALAVDMESLAVAQVCQAERVRFLAVRVISDPVDHALPSDVEFLVRQKTTAARLGAAAATILRRPKSVKDLWQLNQAALAAAERLGQFLSGVVEQLPH